MVFAMDEAEITPDKVDYINAHGTSTHANDLFETKATKKALGEHAYDVKISSTKSMIGHGLGAAGAIEFITCVKSIEEDYIHPTVGLKVPDEECDLDYTLEPVTDRKVNYVMSNSLGFGGHNAVLLMKELIAAVSSANVDEFEYNNEEFSIRIAKKKAKIATVDASVAGVPIQSAAIMPEQSEEQPEELLYGDEIKAPLVGTFYVAPSEGAEPFVSVGDKVKKGQVIGIVEAMKLMNEVESEYEGTVAAILVENGEMVEYGQPLMVIQ